MKELTPENKETFTCMCCDTTLKYCDGFPENDWVSAAIDGGTVFRFSVGYGSTHDGDIYYAALCDKCIDKKKNKLEYVGNYIFGD